MKKRLICKVKGSCRSVAHTKKNPAIFLPSLVSLGAFFFGSCGSLFNETKANCNAGFHNLSCSSPEEKAHLDPDPDPNPDSKIPSDPNSPVQVTISWESAAPLKSTIFTLYKKAKANVDTEKLVAETQHAHHLAQGSAFLALTATQNENHPHTQIFHRLQAESEGEKDVPTGDNPSESILLIVADHPKLDVLGNSYTLTLNGPEAEHFLGEGCFFLTAKAESQTESQPSELGCLSFNENDSVP